MITNAELRATLYALKYTAKPETEQDEWWTAGAIAVVSVLLERSTAGE